MVAFNDDYMVCSSCVARHLGWRVRGGCIYMAHCEHPGSRSCRCMVVVRASLGDVVGTYHFAHMRGCIERFVGMAWNFFAYQRTMFG